MFAIFLIEPQGEITWRAEESAGKYVWQPFRSGAQWRTLPESVDLFASLSEELVEGQSLGIFAR